MFLQYYRVSSFNVGILNMDRSPHRIAIQICPCYLNHGEVASRLTIVRFDCMLKQNDKKHCYGPSRGGAYRIISS